MLETKKRTIIEFNFYLYYTVFEVKSYKVKGVIKNKSEYKHILLFDLLHSMPDYLIQEEHEIMIKV